VELLVAVAVGLNPYAGAVVLAALAAFTAGVPLSETGALVPGAVWALAAVCYGAAMPVDFVLSKFTHLAPRLRGVSHILAPLTAGLAATAVQQSALPTPLVAAGAALLAWVLNTTVTANAARVSRSPEYAGLGHIPVLMSAAVGGACIVPLGLALPGLGYGAAAVALMLLGLAELGGRTAQPLHAGGPARSVAPASTRRPARKGATHPALAQTASTTVSAPSLAPALRGVGRASGRAYARAYARAI
jgi:hypothetical protein